MFYQSNLLVRSITNAKKINQERQSNGNIEFVTYDYYDQATGQNP
jgi:hypothetical protein